MQIITAFTKKKSVQSCWLNVGKCDRNDEWNTGTELLKSSYWRERASE